MTELEVFLRFLLAIGLGALIGAERERFGGESGIFRQFGGFRTFITITLLGAVTAYLAQYYFDWFIVPAFGGLVVLIGLGYMASVKASGNKDIGLTGEITALLSFFIGVMSLGENPVFAIVLAIIVTTVLYLKERLHSFVHHLSKEEIYSTLVFGIVAFVILPFLPNSTFGPLDVLNPYTIWLMVVFISGMGYVGYILIKILGAHRGIGLTGLLGGLVSSTAVTTTMASNSKRTASERMVRMFVFATIIANAVMFVRVIIEVYVVNRSLLDDLLLPMCVMAVVALIGSLFFWWRRGGSPVEAEVPHTSPFTLRPALKFGLLFAIVLVLVKLAQMLLGEAGIMFASVISGFVDVDAITLTVAGLAGDAITEKAAVTAIVLAAMSNTAVKFVYAWLFGSKEFKKYLGVVFACVVAAGLITIWFF